MVQSEFDGGADDFVGALALGAVALPEGVAEGALDEDEFAVDLGIANRPGEKGDDRGKGDDRQRFQGDFHALIHDDGQGDTEGGEAEDGISENEQSEQESRDEGVARAGDAGGSMAPGEGEGEQDGRERGDLHVGGGVDERRVDRDDERGGGRDPLSSRGDFAGEHQNGRDEEPSQHRLAKLEDEQGTGGADASEGIS